MRQGLNTLSVFLFLPYNHMLKCVDDSLKGPLRLSKRRKNKVQCILLINNEYNDVLGSSQKLGIKKRNWIFFV